MKIRTAKAWGAWCRNDYGDYTELAMWSSASKPVCANPKVRVRIIPETDYKRLCKRARVKP